MRRTLLMTAAVLAAVIFFLLSTLPPRPMTVAAGVDPELQRRTIAGAYHIHSTRSDGAGDKEAIATAAERAALAFIILTDHGDGTRRPDPAVYLHHVLCIDSVEISTNGGHYVALDMQPAPYPLGGEPGAVVEDVRRLGGFGIAAHPDSPRPELAWTDWNVPIDGMEWLNADSEWRDESRPRLARILFDYLWRPAPALASMLDRPVKTLARWDQLTAHRRVVALAGHDAHGGIGRGVEEAGRRRAALGHIPSYEASFRTFSTRVILERPLSGDAAADARQVLDAIRQGRVFTVIDALATPGFIDVRAEGSTGPGEMGAALPPPIAASFVTTSLPSGAELISVSHGLEDRPGAMPGQPVGRYRTTAAGGTGAVRFEIRMARAPGSPPVPWLVSNPVYFLRPPAPDASAALDGEVVRLSAPLAWHVEKDPESRAALANGDAATLDYSLAAGERRSQFAAAAVDLRGRVGRFSAVTFSAAATQPMRVSIQLRFPVGGGERWAHSIYVDSTSRAYRIGAADLVAADARAATMPDPSTADSLLFVVDLTNARPGAANRFTIGDLRFVR